jgi:catechol 2,3-dioxygenase-like lactoylglutathione lyase family enzyme
MQRIAHINLRIPTGGEEEAQSFWCGLLGMTEHPKPEGNHHPGKWFQAEGFEIHVSPDDEFAPATKAHIAFVVEELNSLAPRLIDGGVDIRPARGELGHLESCFLTDPFGNRLELMTPWAADNPD